MEGMKELCRESNPARMAMMRSLLDSRGIETVVEREFEYDPFSIITMVPPRLDPGLCVVHEDDFEKAESILHELFRSEKGKSREEVACPKCGAMNPANFEVCWSCESCLLS